MPRLARLLAACLLLISTLPAGADIPAGLLGSAAMRDGKPSLAPILEPVLPGVVNIATRGRIPVEQNPLLQDPFFRYFFGLPRQPREREFQSLGSGVIVDAKKGYILTNNHVIDKAQEITVTLRDRRRFQAKVVGKDPATDIALIQIEADDLTALEMADSDRLRVGDFVIAIGNPFGLGQTVTSGIVSALGRSGLGIEGYEDFIQTDASINPGNSGGALIDLDGRLVGINTAIVAPSGGNVGIGFAIPVNMARDIMEQLIEYGEVRRGRLGVYVQDLTPELARAFGIDYQEGAVITQVADDSPAAKAGLKPGDVVVAVNGKPVRDAADLRNRIGLLRVGQRVRLKIVRNGSERTVIAVITVPKRVTLKGEKVSPLLRGAVFALTEEDTQPPGVVVEKVARGSPAWSAGLRPGDLILSVNRIPVHDLEDLQRAAKRSRRGLLLNIQRGNAAMFILIQ